MNLQKEKKKGKTAGPKRSKSGPDHGRVKKRGGRGEESKNQPASYSNEKRKPISTFPRIKIKGGRKKKGGKFRSSTLVPKKRRKKENSIFFFFGF